MTVVSIENLRKSLQFTLKWEVGDKPNGGYTDDPNDPGGETKYGIAKRFHPDVDIKNLTPEQALQIYSTEYWDRAGCDGLEFPLCTAVFDTAVNCGVDRAVSWLRGSANVYEFLNRRVMFYYEQVNKNPSSNVYLKGWLNRVTDLRKFVDINSPLGVTQDLPSWGSLG
jgi:hypothetical protein